MTTPSDADRLATQRFALFDILCSHCGETLTPQNIDIIFAEMVKEIQSGPCAWAFIRENKVTL